MIKKAICVLLILSMTFSLGAFAESYGDVDYSTEAGKAIDVLSALGVLSGSGDGNFNPNDYLTRAQFSKIAVCVLGKADSAVASASAFSDVSASDWYSGYVNIVSKEGIIEGYPDGSFGANNNITYAQAITVLIRLLGYNAEDVGYKWPQGYLEKAGLLKITDGISFDYNAPITRAMAALLVYRTLFTDSKSGALLVTNMDAKVYEDTLITATKLQNTALLENEVQTSQGTFKRGTASVSAGLEGTLVVNDDSEIIAFMPNDDQISEDYVLSRVYKETNSKNISIVTESGREVLLPAETVLYSNGDKKTLEALVGVTEGSTLTVFYENNSLKYALLNEYRLEGPKTARSKDISQLFTISDISSLKVIRKGVTAKASDIEVFDVCYYSEKTNTLYAYTDRVSGVYEEAYPIKANVSSVKISGKTYELSTSQAISRLNESAGAFKIGDRVTLLLGLDGTAVDAVSLTDADLTRYGVLLGMETAASEDKETLGRAEYYVKLLMADGTEVRFLTNTDKYSDKAGKFCEVDFENSYAKLTFPAAVTATGKVDKESMTFAGKKFASEYSILEKESGSKTQAAAKKITASDLHNVMLYSSDVLHVQTNAKGEIVVLYVDNASGNRDTYGIIVEVSDYSSYTMLSGTQKISLSGSLGSLGDAIRCYQGMGGMEVSALTKIATGNSVTNLVDNCLTLNSQNYVLSDDVAVYAGKNVTDLKAIALNDIVGKSGDITLYSDRSVNEGGRVRVIKIYE